MAFILTHRGLDPSKTPYFSESSREAFEDQLKRGFGLEFDILPKDGRLLVAHDEDLSRIEAGGCHVADLQTLLNLIDSMQAPGAHSALHFKGRWQTPEVVEGVHAALAQRDVSKLIIFDVTLETARMLKVGNPSLLLAPSVAHPYDIVRYGSVVGNTLMTLEDAVAHRDVFDWVWLDEWDRKDERGEKKLYTKEVFERLRNAELSIALVTPELHATSPHLLGGEAHEDGRDKEALMDRIKEIATLQPDALCTDYPDAVRATAYL